VELEKFLFNLKSSLEFLNTGLSAFREQGLCQNELPEQENARQTVIARDSHAPVFLARQDPGPAKHLFQSQKKDNVPESLFPRIISISFFPPFIEPFLAFFPAAQNPPQPRGLS
jgi:hypothetical protein